MYCVNLGVVARVYNVLETSGLLLGMNHVAAKYHVVHVALNLSCKLVGMG